MSTVIETNYQTIIQNTAKHIKNLFSSEGTGHDWWHIFRVWQTAKKIAQMESANLVIVELTALLHDVADWKFHDGDISAGPKAARAWLKQQNMEDKLIDQICDNIENISFKGANVGSSVLSLEGKIVQDADRLDALGAIGIARAFAYGGSKNRPLHDPNIEPYYHNSFEEYKTKQTTTINHFYEKLLLLKDKMQTKTGKELAEKKHQFMEEYLKQFFLEWGKFNEIK